MAHSYVQFGVAKPAVLQLMFGKEITQAPKESSLRQTAREAFLELLRAAAAAADIPVESNDSFQLAIACWLLVHGYSTLSPREPSVSCSPPHGVETVVRLIELDPRHWSKNA
jgi:hypothetical protein